MQSPIISPRKTSVTESTTSLVLATSESARGLLTASIRQRASQSKNARPTQKLDERRTVEPGRFLRVDRREIDALDARRGDERDVLPLEAEVFEIGRDGGLDLLEARLRVVALLPHEFDSVRCPFC